MNEIQHVPVGTLRHVKTTSKHINQTCMVQRNLIKMRTLETMKMTSL